MNDPRLPQDSRRQPRWYNLTSLAGWPISRFKVFDKLARRLAILHLVLQHTKSEDQGAENTMLDPSLALRKLSTCSLAASFPVWTPITASPEEVFATDVCSRYARYGADVWARNPWP